MGTTAAHTGSLRRFISSTTDCTGFLRTEKYYRILADSIQKLYSPYFDGIRSYYRVSQETE